MIDRSVVRFVALGLAMWGFPATLVLGSSAILLTLTALVPFSLYWSFCKRGSSGIPSASISPAVCGMIVVLTAIYLVLDGLLGREKLLINLFLTDSAIDRFVDSASDSVSRGRGIVELIGAFLLVLPFALFDAAKRAIGASKYGLWLAGVAYVFYDVGISRGYLLIAVIAVFAGERFGSVKLGLAAASAMLAFALASFARGDVEGVSVLIPLFDGVVWPYVNLKLLSDSACGSASWWQYALEFAKKFLPAFIFDKTVFSFNIEMTNCIYPASRGGLTSISVFTWLGETIYYQPSYLTAFLTGLILCGLAGLIDTRVDRLRSRSLGMFVGLMCIVLLRSRAQDVFSFLIFVVLFLLIWERIVALRLRVHREKERQRSLRTKPASHGAGAIVSR